MTEKIFPEGISHYFRRKDGSQSPNLEKAVLTTEGILKEDFEAVSMALPAIHRVQKCFGPIETRDKSKFLKDLAFDLESFGGRANPSETAERSVGVLERLEIAATNAVVFDRTSLNFTELTDLMDENMKIITRVFWRGWNTNGSESVQEAIISLYKLILGNIRYSRLSTWRDSDITHPMTDDSRKEEGDILRTWLMIRRSGNKGISPSAEAEAIPRETLREFAHLAKGTTLEWWLKGATYDEIGERCGWGPLKTNAEMNQLFREVCEKGMELYGWSTRDMEGILSIGNKPKRERLKESWVLDNNQMWDTFRKFDLPRLMGLIEMMKPFEQRAILKRLGYIAPELTVKNWCKAEGIDGNLYLSNLKGALAFIDQHSNSERAPERSIRQIVDDNKVIIIRNSQNRRITEETSTVLRIVNYLERDNFPAGTLTEVERKIMDYLISTKRDDVIPSQKDISVALQMNSDQVRRAVMNMSEDNPLKPQYATREYRIKTDSIWHKLIQWEREHISPEEQLDLRFLNSFQLQLYQKIVEIDEGYYSTVEEITNDMGKRFTGRKKMDLFHTMEQIYERIIHPDFDVAEFETKLQAGLDKLPPKQRLIGVEFLRMIREGESLGHGYKNNMSHRLSISLPLIDTVIKQFTD